MSKATAMAAVASSISEALITTALGLFVAVPAVWGYNVLSNAMEAFSIELTNCSLELTTHLAVHLRRPEHRQDRS